MPRDKGGVVDPHLKVYGTKNVRVCDASIFPMHIQVSQSVHFRSSDIDESAG